MATTDDRGDISDVSTVSSKRARSDEESEDGERLRKRSRTQAGRRYRKRKKASRSKMPTQFKKVRGKFALLQKVWTDFPIEVILFEIFCYLDPRDLIYLARTCKKLRGILMSKSSESIWRIARGNVEDLPPLLLPLNEPQYAHLIYDMYCHVCNKPWRCDNILWRFCIRCCRNCEKTFPPYQWDIVYDMLHPFTFFDIIPKERVKGVSVYDHQTVLQLKAQFLALTSEEDRRAWAKTKREQRRAIENYVRDYEAWHQQKLAQRTSELQDIRNQRLQAILTRLERFNLRQEAEYILSGQSSFKKPDEFVDLHSVNQPKQLTNRGWAYIETDLVAMLSEHNIRRLEKMHIEACQERYSLLRREYLDILAHEDLRNPYPGVGDILTDQFFETLIWDTVTEEDLAPAFLRSKLLEQLPRILAEWRPLKIRQLFRILRKTRRGATISDLHLATTIFGCAKCDVLMVYTQVFYHRCCFNNRAVDGTSHDRMRTLNESYDTSEDGPWSPRSIFLHSESSQLAEKIVIGAGLDPATATANDLTFARPVIECPYVPWDFPGRIFVTWPAALTHNLTVKEEILFTVNRFGEETSRIRVQEPLNIFTEIACCMHCHEESTPHRLPRHLNTMHGVEVQYPNTATGLYKLFQTHWYWNPRSNLDLIGMEFRCE